jgi:hypothetical protein
MLKIAIPILLTKIQNYFYFHTTSLTLNQHSNLDNLICLDIS